jgi:hypothetical protein
MLQNVPIWLNEMLVGFFKFIAGVLTFVSCIVPIILLVSFIVFLVHKKEEGKKLSSFFKSKLFLSSICVLLVTGIGLIIFYAPYKVIPDVYEIDSMTIKVVNDSVGFSGDNITINDKDKINEFRKIFSGQICRRSFDSGGTTLDGKDDSFILIDFVASEKSKSTLQHFIVKNNIRRYTAWNTDFIYMVEDKNHQLSQKVFDFVDRYGKSMK